MSEEDGLEPSQIEGKKVLEDYFDNVDHSFHKVSHSIVEPAVNIFVESCTAIFVCLYKFPNIYLVW